MIENLQTLLLYFSIAFFVILILICIVVREITSPYPKTFRTDYEKKYFDSKSEKFLEFPTLNSDCSLHLSVVVPAYNEEERLSPMLDECLSFLEERQAENENFKYEVIIVSDGSVDGTVQLALQYSKNFGSDKVRVLQLETNRGKGGAVTMGVESSRGSVILFADADGATTFADLAKLESALALLVNGDYTKDPRDISAFKAIICGSRAHLEQEAVATRSVFRNFLMHGFHFLVWLLAVRNLRDTQCGFKLFTREAARQCFKSLHVQRWAFDVELLYIAERLGIKTVEVSVRWVEMDGSKLVPFWSWLQMGRDLFLIWFKYRIHAWKLVQ